MMYHNVNCRACCVEMILQANIVGLHGNTAPVLIMKKKIYDNKVKD